MTDSEIEETIYGNKRKSFCHVVCRKSEWKTKEPPTLHPTFNSAALTGFKRVAPVDPDLLKKDPKICIICGVDFKTRAALHSHLTRHSHRFQRLDPVTSTLMYECRGCGNILSMNNLGKHPCHIRKQDQLIHRIRLLHRDGSGLVCILCRGRLLPSRVHLIIHLIMIHSVHRDPFRCMFCNTKFSSENAMMQEAHAFECHAPVLFLLMHKACHNMIRDNEGHLISSTVPFVCLYDSSKLEPQTKSEELDPSTDKEVKNTTICTNSFLNLPEFTVHVLCCHGAVASSGQGLDQINNPIEETRIMINKSRRVPGPSIIELLRIQNEACQANMAGQEEEAPQLVWKDSLRSSVSKFSLFTRDHIVLLSNLKSKKFEKRTEQCRMCLESFLDRKKFIQHIMNVHRVEAKIRLEHLVEKDQLADQLNIDTFCSDCHRIFANNLALQIHMAVSHAGRDWRHCGICDYEFFSESGTVPHNLLLSSQDTLRKPEKSIGSENWSMSPELLWRLINVHESSHLENFYPNRQTPYLPLPLFQHLISSQAVQSGLASSWLIKLIHEIEGKNADDQDPSDLYGPLTAEEAFIENPNKIRSLVLDQSIVSQALATFDRFTGSNDSTETTMFNKPEAVTGMAGSKIGLPLRLLERFKELGQIRRRRLTDLDLDVTF